MQQFDCLTLGALLIFQLLLEHIKLPVCRLSPSLPSCFWGSQFMEEGRCCLQTLRCALVLECAQSYVHTLPIPKLGGEKPVDGVRPYSPGAVRTQRLRVQCRACVPRAAGGNVSRRPRLGEAGCPSSQRSSLAPCSVVSVLRFLSRGTVETRSPL